MARLYRSVPSTYALCRHLERDRPPHLPICSHRRCDQISATLIIRRPHTALPLGARPRRSRARPRIDVQRHTAAQSTRAVRRPICPPASHDIHAARSRTPASCLLRTSRFLPPAHPTRIGNRLRQFRAYKQRQTQKVARSAVSTTQQRQRPRRMTTTTIRAFAGRAFGYSVVSTHRLRELGGPRAARRCWSRRQPPTLRQRRRGRGMRYAHFNDQGRKSLSGAAHCAAMQDGEPEEEYLDFAIEVTDAEGTRKHIVSRGREGKQRRV
ncbi:hypothetical protein HYPSUDRAFT_638737 [Hypholoma sublateritium FD-334 SS-4]|uniref:Uncharacterized protein n=1 Tax=Hypholoma sublateritium (strain FD-334 SS-4) TaxID=945553 RepID=A0A0D2MGN6_HYPSF|nr:hypothetical protein HYPSUDRAFT_638737 [Hypholoma sublateritium FD-334 SS-4]